MPSTGVKKAKLKGKPQPQYRVTASRLRADVYNILDQVVKTGTPVLIERRGTMLKLDLEQPLSKLERLKRNATPGIWVGDREDIMKSPYDHSAWLKKWGITDEQEAAWQKKVEEKYGKMEE